MFFSLLLKLKTFCVVFCLKFAALLNGCKALKKENGLFVMYTLRDVNGKCVQENYNGFPHVDDINTFFSKMLKTALKEYGHSKPEIKKALSRFALDVERQNEYHQDLQV